MRLAFLDHLAIFFTNQELTPHQQLAFAKQFDQTMEYPLLEGLPECPQITPVVKLEHEGANFGGLWHSDTTYLECPPMGSILYAVEIPPYGGDQPVYGLRDSLGRSEGDPGRTRGHQYLVESPCLPKQC